MGKLPGLNARVRCPGDRRCQPRIRWALGGVLFCSFVVGGKCGWALKMLTRRAVAELPRLALGSRCSSWSPPPRWGEINSPGLSNDIFDFRAKKCRLSRRDTISKQETLLESSWLRPDPLPVRAKTPSLVSTSNAQLGFPKSSLRIQCSLPRSCHHADIVWQNSLV